MKFRLLLMIGGLFLIDWVVADRVKTFHKARTQHIKQVKQEEQQRYMLAKAGNSTPLKYVKVAPPPVER